MGRETTGKPGQAGTAHPSRSSGSTVNCARPAGTRRLTAPPPGSAMARDRGAATSFGMFSCSKASNEMNYAAQKFTRAVMACNNIDSCNRT